MDRIGNTQYLQNGRINVDIIKVVFRQCSPEWVMPRNIIEHSNLTLITAGTAEYILGGKRYRVGTGDLIYVPHGDVRQAQLDLTDPMRCYSVDFVLSTPNRTLIQLPITYVRRIHAFSSISNLFCKMNVSWLQRSGYYQLQLKALFELLLYNITAEMDDADSTSSYTDSRIKAMMEHIARHYADPLSLEQYAEQFDLNKVYLGMLFKKNTGITYHQYLMNARLNAAEDLLCTGKYLISEVAYMTGFQDPAYFNRVFSKSFGSSPGRHKRAEKPSEPKQLMEEENT